MVAHFAGSVLWRRRPVLECVLSILKQEDPHV